MQAPPPIPGQPNMISQAVQNRVVSRGLNEVLPEKATAAIPNKAPVFDAVPVPVEQIAAPVTEAAPLFYCLTTKTLSELFNCREYLCLLFKIFTRESNNVKCFMLSIA